MSVICPTCDHKFCSRCKLDWHGYSVTCDEADPLSYQLFLTADKTNLSFGLLEDTSSELQIKRCPACRVPIERNDGCAQMMCKRCGHCFCWYCLFSLDGDFFLRHYDKGPCKNKLGHSRASIMIHRAQVIGIFVGFSFLMIIAAPFLLLAAPCILCCKCRKYCPHGNCWSTHRAAYQQGRPSSNFKPEFSSIDFTSTVISPGSIVHSETPVGQERLGGYVTPSNQPKTKSKRWYLFGRQWRQNNPNNASNSLDNQHPNDDNFVVLSPQSHLVRWSNRNDTPNSPNSSTVYSSALVTNNLEESHNIKQYHGN